MAYKNRCAKLINTPLSLQSVSFSSWQHPHERKFTDFTQFWSNRLISYTPSFPLYYTSKPHALKNITEVFSFSGLSGSFCLFGLSATHVGPISDPRRKQRLHASSISQTLTDSWCCPWILKKCEIDLWTVGENCQISSKFIVRQPIQS